MRLCSAHSGSKISALLTSPRRDESAKELAEMRPRIDNLQMELRQRVEEGRKMLAQLRSYEEKERIWKKEKSDLEKRIEIKDAMATAERKNHDEWKKRNLAEKAELERKVKLAEPEIAKALDA
uniref:TPH domain-containing protein n=1 Tax=Ascaris lumbricoides TaxID=6252 RepID=A0A0M3HFI8_ASCLU